jgi:predicted PurR-regulated permease PerM
MSDTPAASPDDAPATGGASAQTISLIILATLGVFYCLSAAADLVVPLMLAMLLKLLMQPVMRFLGERLGLPDGVSALLIIFALIMLVAAIGLSIAVPASGWLAKAPDGLRALEKQFDFLRGPLGAAQYMLQQVEHLVAPQGGWNAPPATPAPAGSPISLSSVGMSVLLGTQQFFGRLFVLVVALFFMLAAGNTMLRKLVEVTPRLQDKKHVVFIAGEIESNVSGYLATITAINLGFGVLAGISAWLCGIADPLLWGTVAFLLNYIPIVGPIIGMLTMFLVGLLTFSEPLPALLPAGIYLAMHVIEGQIITPMLLARRFTLSPLLVILSLFFWNWMWGVPGALLSMPLLAVTKIICDRIPALAALGHMMGPPGRRAVP